MLRKNLSFMSILTPLTLLLLLIGCGSRPDAAVGSNIAAASTPVPTPSVPSIAPEVSPKPTNTTPLDASETTLLVTHSKSDYISFLNPASGSFEKLIVGQSPFAIAEGPNHRAYVSTAEGVAVVDTQLRRRLALVPYQADIGKIEFGEYRPGGMGIAVSPDGRFVYVGVYLPGRSKSQLETMDTEKLSMIGSVTVGIRPFDVVTSLDGREVYSIDHDSYSVTAIDLASNKARTLDVVPYGRGGFEKPHYAAVRSDGRLLLPYQGRGLVVLDPISGKYETKPLPATRIRKALPSHLTVSSCSS
ncbi:YncE family protein [Paenibacillus sp. TAF58]